MRGTGAGPRSIPIGKPGKVGRTSGRSADSIAAGDRIDGKPPGGICGLALEACPHCSGAGTTLGAKPGDAGRGIALSPTLGGLLYSLGTRLTRSSLSSSADRRLRLFEVGECTYSGVITPGVGAVGDVAEADTEPLAEPS